MTLQSAFKSATGLEIEEGIKKAKKAGWLAPNKPINIWRKDGSREDRVEISGYVVELVLLDPFFWKCIGVAEGWKEKVVVRRGAIIGNFCIPKGKCFEEMGATMDYLDPWLYYMHLFVDRLAEEGE